MITVVFCSFTVIVISSWFQCDGVRGAWQPVAKVSHFNEQRVCEDSRFLEKVR